MLSGVNWEAIVLIDDIACWGGKIIEFKVMKKIADSTKIPERLAKINYLKPSDSKRSRVFSMEGSGHNVSINGKQMYSSILLIFISPE